MKTRYLNYNQVLKTEFAERVQKISINAGFTCPNRDGSKGTGGCTYCNNQTFSPEYCKPSKSISQQVEEGIAFFHHKYAAQYYLAYFQSYTNTYDKIEHLKAIYEEALSYPNVRGLVIGTRPDCVSDELLDYFAELAKNYYVMIEYGIESTCDKTLEFAEHPEWFKLYTVEEYCDLAIDFIEHLSPEIGIERFVSQSPYKLLIAPEWGLKNFEFLAKIEKRLEERDTWQGRKYTMETPNP